MAKRQMVVIDEDLCTGCGECIPNCAEGALEIVDGKVRVVEEVLCDGLGACLGHCPEGALTVEEREAPEFDEEAVARRLEELGQTAPAAVAPAAAAPAPRGCPGSLAMTLDRAESKPSSGELASGDTRGPGAAGAGDAARAERSTESLLGHWPVQLGLVNPLAPYFRDADLLVAADCAPVAYRMFHEDFLDGRSVVLACPKLDDAQAHLEKLAELFRASRPRSVTVAHMEVPCCFGLVALVRRAAEIAGLEAPVQETVITVRGSQQTA